MIYLTVILEQALNEYKLLRVFPRSQKVFKFCIYASIGVCAMSVGGQGGQKIVLDPLELGLQAVVSRLKGVLGTKLGSSGKAASAPNS